MKLFRDVNTLRAMRITRFTTDAVACLTQLRNTPVVPYQKRTARLPIILILPAFGYVSFVHTFIIMQQYPRNINAIRTRHTILTVVTRHGRIFHNQLGGFFQELIIFVRQRNQRRLRTQVVYQMLFIGHPA